MRVGARSAVSLSAKLTDAKMREADLARRLAALHRDLEAAQARARAGTDAVQRERDRLERRHVQGAAPGPRPLAPGPCGAPAWLVPLHSWGAGGEREREGGVGGWKAASAQLHGRRPPCRVSFAAEAKPSPKGVRLC